MRIHPVKACIAFVLFSPLASAVHGESMIALRPFNGLSHFDSSDPMLTFQPNIPITGLVAGDMVVAIDVRPANGRLYGLGVNGATAHLYIIDPTTGAAVQVGGDIALPQSAGTVAPETSFGFDFNPAADRIRVVADNRDNFRLDPNNGTVAGVDVALNPGTPAVVGAAYTNNVSGVAQTTLYGIDTSSGQLVRIGGVNGSPSPNSGIVTAVGPLGVSATLGIAGFDISPTGTAYASLHVNSIDRLYTVDLATGAATLVGAIGVGIGIFDVAVLPPQPQANDVPALSVEAMVGFVFLLGMAGTFLLRSRR